MGIVCRAAIRFEVPNRDWYPNLVRRPWKGAKIDGSELRLSTALQSAVKRGNEGLLRLLLSEGADFDAPGGKSTGTASSSIY